MTEKAPESVENGPETINEVRNSFGYGLSLYVEDQLVDSAESHTYQDQESAVMTRETCDQKAAGKPWAVIKHKVSNSQAGSDHVGMVGGGMSTHEAERFCAKEE